MRDSWDNAQLKQGVIAAFAVAKAAAVARPSLSGSSAGLALLDAVPVVADCLLKDTTALVAATIALQLAVQRRLVTSSSGPP